MVVPVFGLPNIKMPMKNKLDKSRRNFFKRIFAKDANALLNPYSSLSSQLKSKLPPLAPMAAEVLFLNRTSFGIAPDDYARIKSIGIENYLEEQLDYENIADSEFEDLIQTAYPLLDYGLPEIVDYIEEGNALGEDREADTAIQLVSATMLRQLYSKRQLFEVMVEFWSNHFNSDIVKGLDLILKYYEDKHIIRANALTSFPQILHADAKSATMMFYLDNYTNTKDGPNENYARELMELHTLGVDRGYSEQDVKEVARCFTGWSIGQNDSDFFEFYDSDHDFAAKIVLGQTIQNEEGIVDGQQVLDKLAYSSTTAGFISEKLVRRFCSDRPDEKLVKTVAKKYLSTDGDIKSMLRAIFHSPQFLDSVDAKFKRPIEFVTSTLRTLDIQSAQQSTEEKFYPLFILFKEYQDSGQVPFFWSPPTGYPDVADYWQNISTLLRRINFANGVAFGDLLYQSEDGDVPYSYILPYDYSHLIDQAQTAQEIIIQLENSLLHRELLAADRQLLLDFLQTQNEQEITEEKIRAVIGLLLSSTYFQMR